MKLIVPPRMRRICVVVSVACALGAGALPLAAAWSAWDPSSLIGADYAGDLAPTDGWRLVAALLLAVPMACVGAGLLRLSALFRDHARGIVFTVGNADRIRGCGGLVVLGALLKPLAHTLAVLAWTHGFPAGSRLLQVTLGLDDAVLMTLGGGIAVMGWVMAEARRLSDDLDGVV